MKVNELRIGNLVECLGIMKVVAIKKDKIKIVKAIEKLYDKISYFLFGNKINIFRY